MKTVVIYGSRYGNTHQVAEAIAGSLKAAGPVQLLAVESVSPAVVADADVVVIGGPTEGHGVSAPVRELFEKLPADALHHKLAASFDTRLGIARFLSGSAATGIANRLRRAGAETVLEPASFIVEGKEPQLISGELRRAEEWGRTLAREVSALAPAAAAPR